MGGPDDDPCALGFALVYVILWDGAVASFLCSVCYLSVRGYTVGILHGIVSDMFEHLAGRATEFLATITGTIVITFVFFSLTVWCLLNMGVP